MFPDSYDTPLLITVYAMVILGGAGSLERRDPRCADDQHLARGAARPEPGAVALLSVILISLVAKVRPWKKLAAILGGARRVRLCVPRAHRRRVARGTKGSCGRDVIGRAVQGWVIRPEHNATLIGNYAFVALIACVLILTLLHGWWRALFLVPTLYLAAFVWENRARLRAVDDASDHPRRVADRAHERAAAGAARHVSGRDRMITSRCLRYAA